MLVDESGVKGQKFNVMVRGRVMRQGVIRRVAENYIINLDEKSQRVAKMVPVTDDGKDILLG